MASQSATYEQYVASKLAKYEKVVSAGGTVSHVKVQDGWGPAEALADAAERDQADVLYHVAIMEKLCGDELTGAPPVPEHPLLHQWSNIQGCIGPRMLTETAMSLGLTDLQFRAVLDFLQQEIAAGRGLAGGE